MRRAFSIWSILALLALGSLMIALVSGSSHTSFGDIWHAVFGPGQSLVGDVIGKLRLPRALAAFAAGGLLALAGALMQVLLRNPLADPYVLGLSGGAAVGALGAMLAGLGMVFVNLAAAIGAMTAIVLVFGLARRDFARQQLTGALDASPRLLLTGVILASGWGAIIALMLTFAPEAKLRGMLFWLMGDLNGVDTWMPAMGMLLIGSVLAFATAPQLNVMLRGEAVAHSLGVDVAVIRRRIYILASLATAFAVTTGGSIGFIGLVIPHALRLVLGNDQRVLLPACALAGGTLLLLADTAARTAAAPLQLPVGVIMAIIGVPSFVYLLMRRRA